MIGGPLGGGRGLLQAAREEMQGEPGPLLGATGVLPPFGASLLAPPPAAEMFQGIGACLASAKFVH